MVGVEPRPRRKAKEVIPGIKLQPFNVLFDNIDILLISPDILDPKSTFVVVLLAFGDFLVDHLKVFDLVCIVLSIFIVILFSIVF